MSTEKPSVEALIEEAGYWDSPTQCLVADELRRLSSLCAPSVEPTQAMLEAGAMRIAMNAQYVATAEAKAAAVWRDMLAASPSAPQPAEGKPQDAREAALAAAWITLHDDMIPASNRYVRAIKAYREVCGSSLKEAKNAVDDLKSGQLRPPISAAPQPVAVEPPLKSLNAMAADLLRPYLKPGQKVIWREAFRWHDDNGVLPNHYDGMELPALAESFNYDWRYDFDFKHAAIVWTKGAASSPQEKESNGGVLGTPNDQQEDGRG